MARPTKLTKKLLQTIVQLLEEREYHVEEICKIIKISKDTWYRWKAEDSEFSDALAAAAEKRLDKILVSAKKGLYKLLEGHEWEETITEGKLTKDATGNEVFKTIKAKKVKKFVLPNADLIKFTLRNLDKQNFKDVPGFGNGDDDTDPDKRAVVLLPGGVKLEI